MKTLYAWSQFTILEIVVYDDCKESRAFAKGMTKVEQYLLYASCRLEMAWKSPSGFHFCPFILCATRLKTATDDMNSTRL